MDDEFAGIDSLGIEIQCPHCRTEMANDGNSLRLAEAPCGAMLECGQCREVTSWRFTLDPFQLRQVPNEWGGRIECPDDPTG
jgi:hypothetical protein